MDLSAQRLAHLFEGTLRQARADEEGEAWTISVAGEGRQRAAGDRLGVALFDALRRENFKIRERLVKAGRAFEPTFERF